MKKKLGAAIFILLTVFALAFTVSNFVPPAQADITIFGTTTWSPESHGHPVNQFFFLYDNWFCLYEESNCSVVTVY